MRKLGPGGISGHRWPHPPLNLQAPLVRLHRRVLGFFRIACPAFIQSTLVHMPRDASTRRPPSKNA